MRVSSRTGLGSVAKVSSRKVRTDPLAILPAMSGPVASLLLVEDDDTLAQPLIEELRASGFEVARAADGEEALSEHDRASPDLVLLDWRLPGIDGLTVLRRLREGGHRTPVLMLTGRAGETDRVLGLEVGADDFLAKPFSVPELMARIRALLRRSRWRPGADPDDPRPRASSDLEILEEDGLVLDPRAYEANLDGKPLALSRLELELLHLFLKNPGRAFSRSYLLDAIWGEGYATGQRAVDNTVLRLRKHLGRRGDSVETVWGLGYRWRSPGSKEDEA